jgi:hypothetical protein
LRSGHWCTDTPRAVRACRRRGRRGQGSAPRPSSSWRWSRNTRARQGGAVRALDLSSCWRSRCSPGWGATAPSAIPSAETVPRGRRRPADRELGDSAGRHHAVSVIEVQDCQATVDHHVASELVPVGVLASHRLVEGDEFVDGLVCRSAATGVSSAVPSRTTQDHQSSPTAYSEARGSRRRFFALARLSVTEIRATSSSPMCRRCWTAGVSRWTGWWSGHRGGVRGRTRGHRRAPLRARPGR